MKRTTITKINTITIDSESLHKNAMELKEEISDRIIKYLCDKKKKDKHYIYSFKIEKGTYRGIMIFFLLVLGRNMLGPIPPT